MKTLKLLVVAFILLFANTAQSQLSVNVNIGSPPAWGPSGYNDVRYYYLPDVEAYYDVQTAMFIYVSGTHWVHRSYLPTRYRNYDLYRGHKVVMTNYRGNSPYVHFKEHKIKYAKAYRGGGNEGNRRYENRSKSQNEMQRNAQHRDDRGKSAFENKGNGNHGNDKKEGHGNGKGNRK